MTKTPTTDYSQIDIDDVLKQRRQVAVIWSLEDVQGVRPDLNDDQACDVLQESSRKHDCEYGFTWTYIQDMADEMFPRPKDNRKSKKGVR